MLFILFQKVLKKLLVNGKSKKTATPCKQKYTKPRLIAKKKFKTATHCKIQKRDSLQKLQTATLCKIKKEPRLNCKTRLLCKNFEKKENATQLQIGFWCGCWVYCYMLVNRRSKIVLYRFNR